MAELLKGRAVLSHILYPTLGKHAKGDKDKHKELLDKRWYICKFNFLDNSESIGGATIKGTFPVMPERGQEYLIVAEEDTDSSFPNSYDLHSIKLDVELNKDDPKSVDKFLSTILPPTHYEAMMSHNDPIQLLENEDVEGISRLHGMGEKSARKTIQRFKMFVDDFPFINAMAKFGLSDIARENVKKHYGVDELQRAIKDAEENIYRFTEIKGFGFKKCDELFLNAGNDPNDTRRIEAYVDYMFQEQHQEGNSYITPSEYITKINEFFPVVNHDMKVFAGNLVSNSPDKYVYINDEDGQRITTKKMYNIEKGIARELYRLKTSKSNVNVGSVDKAIQRAEKINGWQYDESQVKAIRQMAKSNIYVLQGLSGTGKTSALMAYLNLVEASGYSYATCALAGKAADNLTQVTGKVGRTIHSLIGYGLNSAKGADNPLEYDVIVVDEISMVNAEIFYALLKAIRTGSTLIMIGDYGQLDSIDVGVMSGLIDSRKHIPMGLLSKIHRQAEKSGIITHSFNIRQGKKPLELTYNEGVRVYGELEDLEYRIYAKEEEGNIGIETAKVFSEKLNNFDVEDIQIICSTKSTGKTHVREINSRCQRVFNSNGLKDKNKVQVGGKQYGYELCVGDKVINMQNEYSLYNIAGKKTPIYNGNTGIIESIRLGKDEDGNDEKQMEIRFNGIGTVIVPENHFSSIHLGYAITTHKSQGSTIPCVIFALPFHYMLNTKELIYTGMTRASKDLTILTTKQSLKMGIGKSGTKDKKTNLGYFIQEEFKGDNNE